MIIIIRTTFREVSWDIGSIPPNPTHSPKNQFREMGEVIATDVEVRGVVRFLCLLGKENKEICSMLQAGYGTCAPSYSFVKKWAARFRAGRTDLEDDQRSGRPGRSDIPARLLQHLEEDLHMSLRSAAAELGVDKRTIHNTLVSLGRRFVTTRWVPHQLTPELKCRRVAFARELMDFLDWESVPHMRNIITADESWFFHETPHKEGGWTKRNSPSLLFLGPFPPGKAWWWCFGTTPAHSWCLFLRKGSNSTPRPRLSNFASSMQ